MDVNMIVLFFVFLSMTFKRQLGKEQQKNYYNVKLLAYIINGLKLYFCVNYILIFVTFIWFYFESPQEALILLF